MEAVREIVRAQGRQVTVTVPRSLEGRDVEVIVLPIGLPRARRQRRTTTVYGCLHRYANPAQIALEKGAWARAAKEKHGTD